MSGDEVEWRKIPFLPDRYEASSDGRIRRSDRYLNVLHKKTGKMHKRLRPGGELRSAVRPGGKSRGIHPVVHIIRSPDDEEDFHQGETKVCTLIARAFHGCPYDPGASKYHRTEWRVMHLDGDPTNNAASNLEWVGNGSQDQECRERYKQNLRKLAQLREEPVEKWVTRIWGDVPA